MSAETSKPTTVDEYIASFDGELNRAFLTRLRELSRAAAPQAEESLKWGT